jgi:hypothetical protein
MTTLNPKPAKAKKILNTKLLPFAALALVVLALLFLAAPLIRAAGGTARAGNFVTSGSGQGTGAQVVVGGGGTTGTTRQFAVGGGAAAGRVTVYLYFGMLVIALLAAVGMLFTKRWGVVLAIIMGVLYGLFGLVSLLPLLFIRFAGAPNPVNIILGVVHLLLAVGVIVLASIPGKPGIAPVTTPASPSAS